MKRIVVVVAAAILSVGLVAPAVAKDMLVLAEDVPAGLDYDGPSAAIPATISGIVNLLEPLVYYPIKGENEEGMQLRDLFSFEPRLAETWSFDSNTLTWTLNLRRGVKGCDGTTFNADDVVYTFARGKSVSGVTPIAWFLSNVASIEGFTPAVFGDESARKLGSEVRKVDDYTVQVRLSAPNRLFLRVLTVFGLYILDKETMEEHATADDPWSHKYNNEENVPGFGPYCLTDWRKGASFEVRANPDYYRGQPVIDRVVVRKTPQSSNRVVVLRTGQADLSERLNPREYEFLKGVPSVAVRGAFGSRNLSLILNFKSPPWDNIDLRRAVAHALPYQQIIDQAFFGEARKWEGLLPTDYPGFHRSKHQYEYNPAKARSLLESAGFPGGEGLEKFEESFQLIYPTELESLLTPVVTMVRTALREVGFPIELNPIPLTQYGDRQIVKKDLQFGVFESLLPYGVDAGYGMQLFYVSAAKGGINNISNYSDPAFDELYFRLATEGDEQKRNRMLGEAMDLVMRDLALVPLVEYKNNIATSAKITGVTNEPDLITRWVELRKTE